MARSSLRFVLPLATVAQIFPASAQESLTPQERLDRDVAKVDSYHLLLNNHAATTEARNGCTEGVADLQKFTKDIGKTKDWGLVGFREGRLRFAKNRAQDMGCPEVPPPEQPGYASRLFHWLGNFVP